MKIVASRKHYVIHFNTMVQENEETLHKRPVMLAFEKPPPPAAAATSSTNSTSGVIPATITAESFQQVDNSISQALESITLVRHCFSPDFQNFSTDDF